MDAAGLVLLVDSFIKPILVATLLSCCAAGGVLALIVTYAQRFGKTDRLGFRLLVGLFALLLVADTANDCWWMFRVCVRAQLNPAMLLELPVHFTIYSVITGIAVLSAQGFYTWRLWIISDKRNPWFPGFVAVCQLGAYGVSLYMVYGATQCKLFSDFVQIKGAPWAWLALGLWVDVMITAGTTYYLLIKPRKNGATSKDAVVHSPMTRVVLVTARTNLLSLAVQLVTLSLIVWRITSFHYAIVGFNECKVYIASVLITLNSRRSTSETSIDLSDTPGSRKTFGRRTGQHQSVQPGARPFAVQFERATSDDSAWVGAEKGDVELGRLDEVPLPKY
ncbi:hypothetical protein DMC30DRAFT_416239 [Rhodotorula diobovata]|uniref:DUF6534 domain-containing protein n=1 Tax=Rhodotorula diobovata TaxID=5288 RepID=A0A5C5FWM8_9BASI|nr:hypothetical protein DMC30DRAFT_416239 [Rhodotorula diobovata]